MFVGFHQAETHCSRRRESRLVRPTVLRGFNILRRLPAGHLAELIVTKQVTVAAIALWVLG
jgi:hypothetical protein